MPGKTQEVRTIMYSVEANGNVVVHKLPFNGNEKYGMEKLQRLVDRGFTFADPRIQGNPNIPQVIVTRVVDLDKPIAATQAEEAETTEMPLLAGTELTEVSGAEGRGEQERAIKKWRNMNAQERKAYQEAKKGG